MRKFLMIVVCMSALNADVVIKTSLGCKDEATLKTMHEKYSQNIVTDPVHMNLEVMKHNCRIFTGQDKLKAVNHTSKDNNKETVHVMDTANNDLYYMMRNNLQIEQPGTRNIIPLH